MAGTVITIKEKEKYRIQYTYKGKRYSKYIYAKNKKEIDIQLSEFISNIRNSNINNNDVYFGDLSQTWLDNRSNNITHRTREFYKQMLNANILPFFSNYKISEISLLDLTNFFKKLNEKYAKKTMLHYKNLLNLIFVYAMKLNIIKTNPVQLVEVPNGTKNSRSNGVYSVKEVKKLLKALEKEDVRHRLFIDIALKCGLRKGEILGLKWSDINFEANEIYVNESVSYSVDYGQEYKDPKTKNSIRYVELPKTTFELLKEYKEQSTTEYIFAEKYHSYTQWFRRFLKRNELKHITIHGLRHTNATALIISNKIDLPAISARLGHSQTSTTMNIYAHALKERDKKVTKIIDDIF